MHVLRITAIRIVIFQPGFCDEEVHTRTASVTVSLEHPDDPQVRYLMPYGSFQAGT